MAGSEGSLFAVGDRVLVTHTMYEGTFEAKVLKAEWRSEGVGTPSKWYYMLHYNGWNKKYDDWQPECNINKIGPATAEMAVVGGTTMHARAA